MSHGLCVVRVVWVTRDVCGNGLYVSHVLYGTDVMYIYVPHEYIFAVRVVWDTRDV